MGIAGRTVGGNTRVLFFLRKLHTHRFSQRLAKFVQSGKVHRPIQYDNRPISIYQRSGGFVFIYLYVLYGVLRPECQHCGVYLGILAEFATKINVVSTQVDISKLVYYPYRGEEEHEHAVLAVLRAHLEVRAPSMQPGALVIGRHCTTERL